MDRFACKTKIISGAGAVSALEELNCRQVLLVTDPYFMENGWAGKIAALTKAQRTEIFHKVSPDPSVDLAAEGTALAKQLQPDAILALGGGSAIDLAKAITYFSGSSAKLVAIPTTSGSGSEVTDFAVLTHKDTKHPLVDSRICPDMAILDPQLLEQLPPSLVADAGFDILCHALEAFVATGASAISDALAADAFSVAFGLLPASFGGNTRVRLQIHNAATMAGMAFSQAGLGLCHAIAHSLGGIFHVPHGRLNAVLIPAVVDCNSYGAGGKYARLARLAGMGGSADTLAVRNLKNGLLRLRRELKLPQTLQQAGIAPRHLRQNMQQIVSAVLADPCCRTNPVLVEDFMVRRALEAVAGNE